MRQSAGANSYTCAQEVRTQIQKRRRRKPYRQCRTIQLLYFKFCQIISTLSFVHCTYVLLIRAVYLNSLSLLSRLPPLPALSLVSWGRLGKLDLLGALIVFLSQLSFAINCIDCFSITTFIGFKDHFLSKCDNMIRLALFLGSAIVVARLIQTSLHKYFKISFLSSFVACL